MDEILEYKCPCCGGKIEFDSKTQNMKCPYCDTGFDVETLRGYDEVLKKDRSDEMNWDKKVNGEFTDEETEGISVFVCKSCGGEIVCEETTASMFCPYCNNPVIMAGRLSGSLKPDYIIPFKLDKKSAVDGFKKHIKGKRLLPKIFLNQSHIDEIKGVYVPFWLFGTSAEARIRYRATKVRTWSDRNYIYTETRHFSVYREGLVSFENVPVDASSKMQNELMESIEPFDFSEAVDFQTAYLSGFLADKYDVSSEVSQPIANSRIKTSTEEVISSTVTGYSTVMPESESISFEGGNIKYVLYPVWLLNTTWKNKRYYFAMNGQTGKFVGDLPLDKKAYAKWLCIWTAIFSSVALAFQFVLSLI